MGGTNLFVEFGSVLVGVGPGIEDSHLEVGGGQRGETEDDVRAQVRVHVAGSVLAVAASVPRPVGVVADHLVFTCHII